MKEDISLSPIKENDTCVVHDSVTTKQNQVVAGIVHKDNYVEKTVKPCTRLAPQHIPTHLRQIVVE